MSQFSDQTDLRTDTFSVAPSGIASKTGLTNDRKKMLGISAAALLLGGSAWAIVQKQKALTGKSETPEDPTLSGQPTHFDLPKDIDVAGKVTDAMTFEQAFEAARDEVGMAGVFGWHGHWYNTFEKDEWASLSLEQRQEFTELITQEHLPVQAYTTSVHIPTGHPVPVPTEPSIIEGHLNGQRVMGLDFDRDGVIDTLVMEGADGYTYRVVDTTGDDGLDTLYRFDSLNGEVMGIEKINAPFVLTNDQFSQGLEESMSREIVDSILEPHASTDTHVSDEHAVDHVDTDDHHETYEADDDTYINNGDVHDLDD